MTVQVISFSREVCDGRFTFSKFDAPRSLDEFDLSIIDFADETMWYLNQDIASYKILCANDLKSLNVMIQGSQKTKVLFVLPQDIEYHQQTKLRQDSAEEMIAIANERLDKNKWYKSILYSSGDELVKVVFDILEQLFEYDLSKFVDENKEDFLIQKPTYTLIGEIKGISSNVRNGNISQLENHFQKYRDKLVEEGRTENVHQVLIINSLRGKPLDEREPIHEDQIELAKRYGSLIVETSTLLKLFELFLQGTIKAEECEKLLTERTGILTVQDFC